jgi:hypothetical protein
LSANVLTEELELIYAHLVSMRNFTTVRDQLTEGQPAHTEGGASAGQ